MHIPKVEDWRDTVAVMKRAGLSKHQLSTLTPGML